MHTSEEGVSTPYEKNELGTLAESQTEQENVPKQMLKNEKQSECDEDFLMESESGSRGHIENRQKNQVKQGETGVLSFLDVNG